MYHLINILSVVWAPLNNGIPDNGPGCKISVTQTHCRFGKFLSISRPMRTYSLPGGNPQYPSLGDLTTGLLEGHMSVHTSLPYNGGTKNKWVLALDTTLQESTQREGGFVFLHLWKIHLSYTGFISVKIPLLWMANILFQLLKYIFITVVL